MKPTRIQKLQIEDLLKSVVQDYMKHHAHIKTEKMKNIQNLVGLVSEYLSAFIILGYDVNGAPVNFIHAKNQMDADALSAAINKFIFNAINTSDEK
jgi:hypothetical protein